MAIMRTCKWERWEKLVKIELMMGEILYSPQPSDAYKFFQPDILSAVGIIAFAFMCHHNTFLIYQSMEDSSFEKWERVTHFSVG
jgi:solute carrier family 38 (sodium-coupled neutral amino acid transporter), member 11